MTTLTVTLDEDVFKSAEELASSQGKSLDQMVREFLAALIQSDKRTKQRELAREVLQRSFADLRVEVGERSWTREELHER